MKYFRHCEECSDAGIQQRCICNAYIAPTALCLDCRVAIAPRNDGRKKRAA